MAKLGVALGFVVLLAWATVYLLRKSRIGQQYGATGGSIRVAECVYLGPKKQISLVEIGGRVLALGITEENISLLAEWPAGELELTPPAEPPGPFAIHLKKLIGQMREPPTHQERSQL
jgi:flagellar biosynthetic protein FliO